MDPNIVITPAEGTSSRPTSLTWSTSLPVHTRPASAASEWPEQGAYSAPTLDANQDTHLNETLATAQFEYQPTADFNAEKGRDEVDHFLRGTQAADFDDSESTEKLIAEFDERMDKLEIAFALTKAVLHLDRGQDIYAEDEALQGLDLAKRRGDKATIARCTYWLGRIEYHRGNDVQAHRHFLDARPCIGVYDEGHDVPVFLSLFQRSVTEEGRKQILRCHVKELLARCTEPHYGSATMCVGSPSDTYDSQGSSVTITSKQVRKRELGSSNVLEQVLRTSNKRKGEKAKPKLWLVRDRADIYPHAGDGRSLPDPKDSDAKRDMMWLTAAEKSDFRPQQGHFTFTMSPKR